MPSERRLCDLPFRRGTLGRPLRHASDNRTTMRLRPVLAALGPLACAATRVATPTRAALPRDFRLQPYPAQPI
jgi:hypothetical protein